MDSVLLKDYAPNSSLVVPETAVKKAMHAVIDVHTHRYAENPEEVQAWVETMNQVGIEVTVVLTGATGEKFESLVDLFLRPYPDRFQLYCGLYTDDLESPDYPERAVDELVHCYEKGARGVGEVSDKGWGFGGNSENHLPREKRLHLNDSRLDPFWEKCAELNLPVNLHVADHPSCWQPLGPNWERTPDFQGFNLYGKDVPSYEELLARRDDLLGRHPNTKFILCHLSNQGNDLRALSQVMDDYSNLYLDVSARDYELGRQPQTAAAFLDKYRSRVLFGTDMGRQQHMYEAWWRLLESQDEFIPGRLWWRLYGLGLEEDLLRQLYQENSRRILNWEPLDLDQPS
jgi:predicted TIM-barrel fold metal-dependent hydrolase